MEVRTSKGFSQHHGNPFGIRASHIQEAYEKRDDIEIVSFMDLKLVIFVRNITLLRKSYRILAGGRMENNLIEVQYAYKLPDNMKLRTPLEGMQELVGIYGVEFSIGSKRAKFFLKETIEVESSEPTKIFSLPTVKGVYECMMLKIDAGSLTKAQIAMAFCMNHDLYALAMRSLGLID